MKVIRESLRNSLAVGLMSTVTRRPVQRTWPWQHTALPLVTQGNTRFNLATRDLWEKGSLLTCPRGPHQPTHRKWNPDSINLQPSNPSTNKISQRRPADFDPHLQPNLMIGESDSLLILGMICESWLAATADRWNLITPPPLPGFDYLPEGH